MALNKWINFLHRYGLVVVVRFLLNIFKRKGEHVRATFNPILLESATSLSRKIRKRQITSVETLNVFIARIKEVNTLLNCVVDHRFNEALSEAAAADELIASGKYTEDELETNFPFLGVPISTKDCIAVKGLLNFAKVLAGIKLICKF